MTNTMLTSLLGVMASVIGVIIGALLSYRYFRKKEQDKLVKNYILSTKNWHKSWHYACKISCHCL